MSYQEGDEIQKEDQVAGDPPPGTGKVHPAAFPLVFLLIENGERHEENSGNYRRETGSCL